MAKLVQESAVSGPRFISSCIRVLAWNFLWVEMAGWSMFTRGNAN